MFYRFRFIIMIFLYLNFLSPRHDSNCIISLESDSTSLNIFLDILNNGLNSEIQLEVENIHRLSRKERFYCISLSDSAHREHITQDNDLLSYVVARMLPEVESIRLKLISNSHDVLIADARQSILDIGDIQKFDNQIDENGVHLSTAILLHELYEQYYLQQVFKVEPSQAKSRLLAKAHALANLAEGNYYLDNHRKDTSEIKSRFILIRFNSLIDVSSIIYRAYHNSGNILRIVSDYL